MFSVAQSKCWRWIDEQHKSQDTPNLRQVYCCTKDCSSFRNYHNSKDTVCFPFTILKFLWDHQAAISVTKSFRIDFQQKSRSNLGQSSVGCARSSLQSRLFICRYVESPIVFSSCLLYLQQRIWLCWREMHCWKHCVRGCTKSIREAFMTIMSLKCCCRSSSSCNLNRFNCFRTKTTQVIFSTKRTPVILECHDDDTFMYFRWHFLKLCCHKNHN